jgi:hypothetical protein
MNPNHPAATGDVFGLVLSCGKFAVIRLAMKQKLEQNPSYIMNPSSCGGTAALEKCPKGYRLIERRVFICL